MKWKRWICLMLMMALLLTAAAQASENRNFLRNAGIFQELGERARGGCVAGDALVLLGSSHIFSYQMGDEDLTAAAFEPPAAGENESRELVRLFANGDRLCALMCVYRLSENEYGPARLEIAEITLDGGAVRFGEIAEASVEGLTVSYGERSSELMQIYESVLAGGRLFLRVGADSGDRIYALELDSGAGEFLDVEHVRGVTAWKDGGLLIETFDYSAGRIELLICDPEAGSATPACAPMQADAPLAGLAYSAETDRLFYMQDGCVMSVTDFNFDGAQVVAELFVRYADEAESMLMPGDYYVCCAYYDGTSIRSTDPDALPGARITVQSAGIDDTQMNAYYDFNAAHDDAAAVLKENYAEGGEIIEAMMNRDSSVDVYILGVSSEAYDALYERGYMVGLSDASVLAAVEGMYPAVQDVLTRNGEVVAVPAMVYGWTLGLDYEGFERIGIPRDEMPKDWSGFLDLLAELPERLPEDGSVKVFEDYYTQNQARIELVNAILDSWHLYLNAAGEEVRYDVPELREALTKVMDLDLGAMGMPLGDEEVSYVMVSVVGGGGDRTYTLVNPNAGCIIGDMSYNEPALLSVIPGEDVPLPLSMTVAFINPFSPNPDLAQEYLAALVRNLNSRALYNLSDQLNEPVRNRYYQQNADNVQRDIESTLEKLADADPVDAPMWEERVAMLEEQLAEIEAYSWDISPEHIAWFRAHAGELFVSRYNYVDVIYGSEEFDDLTRQFLAGRMDAGAFLTEIDRRVRMKAKEGN